MRNLVLTSFLFLSLISVSDATQFCVGVDANGGAAASGEGQVVTFNDPTLVPNCSFTSDASLQAFVTANPTQTQINATALAQAQLAEEIDAAQSAGYITTAQQTSLKAALPEIVNTATKTTQVTTP